MEINDSTQNIADVKLEDTYEIFTQISKDDSIEVTTPPIVKKRLFPSSSDLKKPVNWKKKKTESKYTPLVMSEKKKPLFNPVIDLDINTKYTKAVKRLCYIEDKLEKEEFKTFDLEEENKSLKEKIDKIYHIINSDDY